MPPSQRSPKQAAAFAAFLVIVTLSYWPPLIALSRAGVIPLSSFGSLVFLSIVVIAAQLFVTYRMLAHLRLLSRTTDRFDAFFYGTVPGNMLMLMLSVVWFLCGCVALYVSLLAFALIDLHIIDPTGAGGQMGEAVSAWGTLAERLIKLLCLLWPFTMLGALVGTVYTAAMAFARIVAPNSRMRYSPLAAAPDDVDEDLEMLSHDRYK